VTLALHDAIDVGWFSTGGRASSRAVGDTDLDLDDHRIPIKVRRRPEVLDMDSRHEDQLHTIDDPAVVVPIAADAGDAVLAHLVIDENEQAVLLLEFLGHSNLEGRVTPVMVADMLPVQIDITGVDDTVETEERFMIPGNLRDLEVSHIVDIAVIPLQLFELRLPGAGNLDIPQPLHVKTGEERVIRPFPLPPRLLLAAHVGIGVELPRPVQVYRFAIMREHCRHAFASISLMRASASSFVI